MERVYRLIFLGLFVLGFIGAAAVGSDHEENGKATESPVAALVKDVRLAEEVNALNEGRWNQDVSDVRQDGLARVENLLSKDDQGQDTQEIQEVHEVVEEPPTTPPDSPEDLAVRAKSELAQ